MTVASAWRTVSDALQACATTRAALQAGVGGPGCGTGWMLREIREEAVRFSRY